MSTNSFSDKNITKSNRSSNSEESDRQTVGNSNNSYQYLISEIKIKSAALTKASNLIQILQVQLEVEKNSKQQAVLIAKQEMRDFYQIEIANLNNKIQMLQSASQKRNISVVLHTQANQNQPKIKRQSRILRRSCSKTLNRSNSKDNKNFITPYRSKAEKFEDDLSLECKMYRKMILQNSVWEGGFIEQFQKATKQETDEIQSWIHNLECYDTEFENTFSNNMKISKKSAILIRIQQYNDLIRKQKNLIYEMRTYQCQLQEVIQGLNNKLNSIFDQKNNDAAKIGGDNWIEQIASEIKIILEKWKHQRSSKQKGLQNENKQLRDIVQQMIVLMNKKKSSWSKDYRSLAN